MKQILMLLVMLLFLNSCNTSTNKERHIGVMVIVDITDVKALYPTSASIIPIFGLGIDESSKVTFRISTMSDKEVNEDIEIRLPGEAESGKQNTDDDLHFRKRQIVGLYNTITDTLHYFINTQVKKDMTLPHSECFKSIGGELNKMKQYGIDTGTVLVFSDVQENSEIYNCYANPDVQLHSPEKIEALFEHTKLLPQSLQGITVFFVYKPQNRVDDKMYMAMVSVYKRLLEKRGATVRIQAQNQSYIL